MKPTKRTTAIAAFALTCVTALPCAYAATGSGSVVSTVLTTLAFLLIAGLAVFAFVGWSRSMTTNMSLREELCDLKLRTGFSGSKSAEEPSLPEQTFQPVLPMQETVQFPAQPQAQETIQFQAQPVQAPVQQVFAPAAVPVQPVTQVAPVTQVIGYAPVHAVAYQPAAPVFSSVPGSYVPRDIENITEIKAQQPKVTIDPTDLLAALAETFPQYLSDISVAAAQPTGAHVAKHRKPQPINVLIAQGGKSANRAKIVELPAM